MKLTFHPERKKVIFFDMNNTIVDKDKSLEHSFKKALQSYTARWDADHSFNVNTTWKTYRQRWKEKAETVSINKRNARELRLQCLKESLRPLPLPQETAFLNSMMEEMQKLQTEEVQLFPDVKSIVEQLASKYKLSILSNSPKQQILRQLEVSGLSRWIPAKYVFSPGQGLPKKPSPKLFEHALSEMKVPATKAIMVGNTWKIDVYGATRSGLDAVWIHRYHKKKSSQRKIGKERVFIIRRFKQLAELFKLD